MARKSPSSSGAVKKAKKSKKAAKARTSGSATKTSQSAKKSTGKAAKKTKKSTDKVAKKAKKSTGKVAKKTEKSTKKTAQSKKTKKAKKAAKKTVPRAADGKSAGGTGKKAQAPQPGRDGRKKRKTPLTRSELKKFQKLLLEKRRSILGDMAYMEEEALRTNRQDSSGDLSLMPDHPANIATDNYEQEFTLGLMESERTMLAEIDEALERITDKTYGVCLGTGKPIGIPRLTARPWAKYCIDYARMVEKGLVRPGETLFDDEDDEG